MTTARIPPRPGRIALPLALRLSVLVLGALALLIQSRSLLPQDLNESEAVNALYMASSACGNGGCLMGVQPGMSMNAATALLQDHPWVERVFDPVIAEPAIFDYERLVRWYWNGKQPAFVNVDRPGYLYINAMNDIVYRIEVDTVLPFGATTQRPTEAWSRQALYWPTADRISYTVSYPDSQQSTWTVFTADIPCPADLFQFVDLASTRVSQNLIPPNPSDTAPAKLTAMCRSASFGY